MLSAARSIGKPASPSGLQTDRKRDRAVEERDKQNLEPEVAAFRAEMVEAFGIAKFTCDDCGARHDCEFAFDPYNTDGDCLAEK